MKDLNVLGGKRQLLCIMKGTRTHAPADCKERMVIHTASMGHGEFAGVYPEPAFLCILPTLICP